MKKSQKKPAPVKSVVQRKIGGLRSAGIEPRFSMAVALENALKRS